MIEVQGPSSTFMYSLRSIKPFSGQRGDSEEGLGGRGYLVNQPGCPGFGS